jgi:hypothetical protein
MTATTQTRTTPAADKVVFHARIGSERIALTAAQVRDTVAAYLARGAPMPTPTDIDRGDPYAPLHVITEEWLWGNVEGWVASTDVVHLLSYRHAAMRWIRGYFGPAFPDLDH